MQHLNWLLKGSFFTLKCLITIVCVDFFLKNILLQAQQSSIYANEFSKKLKFYAYHYLNTNHQQMFKIVWNIRVSADVLKIIFKFL